MKNISRLVLIACLTCACLVYSQDYKKEIKTEFNDYLNLIVTKQFDKSMDYLVPEFFDMFPRKQMVAMMEQVFNSKEMEFEIKDPKILQINEVEKIDDKHYVVLTYSTLMHMKINNPDIKEEDEEEKKMYINVMTTSFEQSFGADNVSYNQATDFFEIYSEKQVCAVSKNGTSDWKFIVLEKGQEMLLQKLLPKKILEKF